MRTIRLMCLTALVLIASSGVGAYFATQDIHDPRLSTKLLFALAWVFCGLGIAISAILIGISLNSPKYGTHALIEVLFKNFAGVLTVTAVVGAFVCAFGASYDNMNKLDGYLFGSMYVALLGGLIVGFFANVLINGSNSWFEQPSSVYDLRKRR